MKCGDCGEIRPQHDETLTPVCERCLGYRKLLKQGRVCERGAEYDRIKTAMSKGDFTARLRIEAAACSRRD